MRTTLLRLLPKTLLRTPSVTLKFSQQFAPAPTTIKPQNWALLPVFAIVSAACLTYHQHVKAEGNLKVQGKLTLEEIKRRKNEGIIIAVGNKIYDVTDFSGIHPGGENVLKAANGYNIAPLWKMDDFKFHNTSENVAEYLNEFYIGTGTLPAISGNEFSSKRASGITEIDYIIHDKRNAEPHKLEFNKSGGTPRFFVRDHADYANESVDLTISSDGTTSTLNNDALNLLDSKPMVHPIICGGAGRSKFSNKVNGTPWGEGGDAIGTMYVNVIPLSNVLEKANTIAKSPCLIAVTGSDGYNAVIHSSELDRFYLTTQTADGQPLSKLHGRERRLIGEGTPGFRNIKSVKEIKLIPELSHEEVNSILMDRVKDPMLMLNAVERQVLAACPKYDSYILRNPTTDKPIGFHLYLPPSVKILKSSNTEVSGIAFSGYGDILKVRVGDEVVATTKPKHASSFSFWASSHPVKAKSYVGIEDDSVEHNDEPVPNKRGLYAYNAKQHIQNSM